MSFKINIIRGDKDAEVLKTVTFEARQAVNGDLLIFDHDLVDIVISREKSKITIFPKKEVSEEVYHTQDRLLKKLSKAGVVDRTSVRSGSVFSSLEGTLFESAINGVSSFQMALSELYDFIQDEIPEIKSRKLYKTQLQDFFLDPEEEESTELGEIPHKDKKGALDHQVRPYGYQYMYSILREIMEK